MDYDNFPEFEEEDGASYVPLSIIEDEIRYLLDIKDSIDRANEERIKQLAELKAKADQF